MNIVADALSRLEFDQPSSEEDKLHFFQSFEALRADNASWLGLEKTKKQMPSVVDDSFPLTYKNIDHEQQRDCELLAKAQKSDLYSLHTFCGGGK
jgi:hypothetical protein